MSALFDLVVRGGTVFDGSGGAPFEADIAIADGRIAQIGRVTAQGRDEIDARGRMVTPGFIDVHTHYDGQLTWSSQVAPSSSHGVTTVVTGNCGVGFAPCRPQDRERLVQLLEGVEDIPEIVTTEGLSWDWETFPDYIAALQRRAHDIDFAVQLPHSALRVFVMGHRAVDREVATAEDLQAMRRLMREAVEAGAIGFGTSRSVFHKSPDGQVIPTAHAPEDELQALAHGVRDAGGGVMQAILDLDDTVEDFKTLRRIAQKSALSLSYSLFQSPRNFDNWKDLLALTSEANAGGPRVTGQVFPRPVGVLLGLDVSYNPFSASPTYRGIAHLSLPERVAEMRKPAVRQAILSDRLVDEVLPAYQYNRRFHVMYPLGNPPCYEPAPDTSVEALAKARGVTPDEVAYDLLLEDEGHAVLMMAAANYQRHDLEAVREMLVHPNTVPALGDGGAHYGMICDSTYPTFMLSYWGRDRPRGRIALPEIVARLTRLPAEMLGLTDRGVLSVGRRANLNVIDFDRLRLHAPRVAHDLPAGGRRIMQDADGYDATIVGGEVILRHGVPTGALPGCLVRRPAAG